MRFERITFSESKEPSIRNLPVTVRAILRCIASGLGETEIIEANPGMDHDDFVQALEYAAENLRSGDVMENHNEIRKDIRTTLESLKNKPQKD